MVSLSFAAGCKMELMRTTVRFNEGRNEGCSRLNDGRTDAVYRVMCNNIYLFLLVLRL